MRQHQTIFANFINKFGDNDLVDYLEDVVLPAFVDDTLYRTRGRSTFYLYDVEVFEAHEGRFVIAGHFVHDTLLRRTQIYDPAKGLVPDEATLASAPSAFFVLTLDDHKLIYHAMTPDAPEVKTFETTMSRFLDKKHRQYIDRLYENINEGGEPITKRRLKELHPEPSLNVIPISGEEEIAEFVHRYSVVKRLDITVYKPNDEIEAAEAIAGMQFIRDRVGAEKAKFTVGESDGLDPEGTIQTLEEAGKSGNQRLQLTGLDQEGNKLSGTNDDFSVRVQVEIPPAETKPMAMALLEKMSELTAAGVLKLNESSPEIGRRIQKLMASLL